MMAIGLYAATVPAWLQQLRALARIMDKAREWCAANGGDETALIGAKLAEDMLPLGYQVKSCVHHSVGAIEGVRAGRFSPDMGGWPQDLAGLKAKLEGAIATLAALDPADIDALAGGDAAFVMGELRMDFTAEDFLLSFSMPNFYFHATTAYDILRARGLPLGKRDFMGRPRLKG